MKAYYSNYSNQLLLIIQQRINQHLTIFLTQLLKKSQIILYYETWSSQFPSAQNDIILLVFVIKLVAANMLAKWSIDFKLWNIVSDEKVIKEVSLHIT